MLQNNPAQRRAQSSVRAAASRARDSSGRRFDAFVEDHDDVRAERDFDFERLFGRKKMLGAIEVRAERHAIVGHFAKIAEAENLKAAGIGEDRVRPGHKPVQAAHRANQFVAGPQIKMIGIAEKYLSAELFEILLRLSLYRCRRANGHECGSFDYAVRRRQTAQARAGRVGSQNFKFKWHPSECIRIASQTGISGTAARSACV